MRKIFVPIALLFVTIHAAAQNNVITTVNAFPFQQQAAMTTAIASMRSWSSGEWKELYKMLDQDSLQLKATYAMSAYVDAAATNPATKKQVSIQLADALSNTKTWYAQNFLITRMNLAGDDACIKILAQKLNDETLVGPASRALAAIKTTAAVAALQKALPKASATAKPQIQAAIDYTNYGLPDLLIAKLTASEEKEGFKMLFDGSNLDSWIGNKAGYELKEGSIVVNPKSGGGGNLYTKETYADFIYRFEFQLTAGANNGIGIRTPTEGDAAYMGMEIQVLDNEAEKYKNLQAYQYHGSVYGVIPARRGFLKATGEWNQEEIIAMGNKIKVILNGEVILEGDIKEAAAGGTMDHKEHPGLFNKKGHIGFLGHGDVVKFRRVRIKEI
ncbi:MAG: hypothetical protein RLZZ28_334 [Bacteroidota bacterium]|jgi:hypothetical protein